MVSFVIFYLKDCANNVEAESDEDDDIGDDDAAVIDDVVGDHNAVAGAAKIALCLLCSLPSFHMLQQKDLSGIL